jgi:hypothetical protein
MEGKISRPLGKPFCAGSAQSTGAGTYSALIAFADKGKRSTQRDNGEAREERENAPWATEPDPPYG